MGIINIFVNPILFIVLYIQIATIFRQNPLHNAHEYVDKNKPKHEPNTNTSTNTKFQNTLEIDCTGSDPI